MNTKIILLTNVGVEYKTQREAPGVKNSTSFASLGIKEVLIYLRKGSI